jgi:hypothetical protein
LNHGWAPLRIECECGILTQDEGSFQGGEARFGTRPTAVDILLEDTNFAPGISRGANSLILRQPPLQSLGRKHKRFAVASETASLRLVPDYVGWIRRADVSLRIHYPNLITRIFEIAPGQFLIVFDKSLQDATQINLEEFRPITLQVKISNEVPSAFIREIPPLPDSQLSRNFEGFPFNRVQLFNLVVGRFPDFPIVAIQDGGTPMAISIELTRSLEPAQEQQLLDFCNGIAAPAPFKLVVTGTPIDTTSSNPSAVSPNDDALFIGASRVRLGLCRLLCVLMNPFGFATWTVFTGETSQSTKFRVSTKVRRGVSSTRRSASTSTSANCSRFTILSI